MEEDIGVFFSGKRFQYNRKRIGNDIEEKKNEIEERDTGVVLHIKGIPHTEEKEKDRQLSPVEGDPLHPT
jgi:hypothetical protein